MRRLLGLKDSPNTPSNTKGKERQRDPSSTSKSTMSPRAPMEVHVNTEIHSAPDRRGFHPVTSTTTLPPPSPASSDSPPLPPEIRVPTHPYPYWQGYTHTPSSSSQSSLESPMTPSHVSWLNLPNPPGNPDTTSNGNGTNLGLTNISQPSAGLSSSFVHGWSSPSPHFPPPPPTNPPPNINTRPKSLHSTKSTHSLRVPVQEFFNQQLSPIVEQDYLSPEKRPASLPSSSHEGGSRSSIAHTARTSAAVMTPVSPGSDTGTATVTPVSPVPITPVLASVRETPPTPQTQVQTPVTPSCSGGIVPFARRKEEDGSESPRKNSSMPSPVSTFILRPLNRSISLSSTRTHQSSVSSVTPPVIPPLDLKPEFRPTFLTTPTTPNSRGLLDVGAHDDDSASDRRASFVTAQTGPGRESKYSLGQEEVFVDAEEGFRCDSNGTVQPFDPRLLEETANTPATPQQPRMPQNNSPKPVKPPVPARTTTHPRSASRNSSAPPSYNLPPGPHSSDDHHQPPQPHVHLHRPIASPAMRPSRSGVSAPSLQDRGNSLSTSSSFIDRRFALSSLYLPPSSERECARNAGSRWTSHQESIDTVQVLFWLGFIAPWCWLIGGWLISPRSPPRDYGPGGVYGGGSLLPLWTNTSKSMQSFDMTKVYHGYPFVAPSALSLTPPPPPYQSQRAAVVLVPKPMRTGGGMKNPWVKRCRIAAVTSGVIIVIVFIVALVVVGTSQGV